MPLTGETQNLNNARVLVTGDGIFDDFFDSTVTDGQMTNNAANTGSSFSQTPGELRIDAGGSVTQAVKAQNILALAPARALPWPIYVNYVIEQGLTVTNLTNLAGVAISHADEAFTTTNKKFWVGIFYDGAASGSNGLEIVDPTGTSTQFTSFDIVLDTFYILQVELLYNFEASTNNTKVLISAWIDDGTGSTKVIDESTVAGREDLFGERVDGSVGLVADLPTTGASGGSVIWDYWICKRLENFLSLTYEKTALFRTGELEASLLNVNSKAQFLVGPNSTLMTFARNAKLELPYGTANSLSSRLIMRLDFNGNSLDSGTLGFNGTLQGNANDSLSYKGYRKVLDLDGTGDFIDLLDININWASQGFSFAFWIIGDSSTATNDRIYFAGTDSASNNHGVEIIRTASADSLSFIAYDSGGTGLGTTTDADFFTDNVPTHCIITVTAGGAVTIYKNNTSAATGTISSQPTSITRDEHAIGMRPGTTASSFDGKIWDFRLWNRVITSLERTKVFETTKWRKRWRGIIKNTPPDKKNRYAISKIQARHVSSLVDSRVFEGTFTNKKTNEIIAEAGAGIIILNVPEFTTTNVETGNRQLTKTYVQEPIREILLQLGAEENFLEWIDDDLDVHSEAVSGNDNGFRISQTDTNLLNYDFPDFGPPEYTRAEIHGTSLWTIVENASVAQRDLGQLTKVIVDNNITTQADANRVGRMAIHQGTSIIIGTVEIISDMTLEIGDTVAITLNDTTLNFNKKKFVIISILEQHLRRTQILTVAEQVADISDFLYETFLLAKRNEGTAIDTAPTKTNTIMMDVDILIWIDFLIETSANGVDFTEHDSGEAIVTNRGIAIVSGCLGNAIIRTAAPNAPVSEGDFSNGLVIQIGTGTSDTRITDTALETRLSSDDKTLVPASITLGTEAGASTAAATVTWDDTEANGNIVTEAGFYADRQTIDAGAKNSTFQYATTSDFAPNNVATQIVCRAIFDPFTKTSSNHMRITFTVHAESGLPKNVRSA